MVRLQLVFTLTTLPQCDFQSDGQNIIKMIPVRFITIQTYIYVFHSHLFYGTNVQVISEAIYYIICFV